MSPLIQFFSLCLKHYSLYAMCGFVSGIHHGSQHIFDWALKTSYILKGGGGGGGAL